MISFKITLVICLLVSYSLSQKMMLVGGGLHDDNSEVYNKFIELSTPREGQPYIGIVTAAASTPEENGKYYKNLLQNTYNVNNVDWIPISLDAKEKAYDKEIVQMVSKMTGIFFGGGDQSRLVICFQDKSNNYDDTPVLAEIRTRFLKKQLTIGGTSAGTAIQQNTPMVTGGESYWGLLYGAHDYASQYHPDDLSYFKRGGFGFFRNIYLDTHFATRGRQGRMIRLIDDLSKVEAIYQGIGIDENTALAIEGDTAEVYGETGVYFFNLKKSQTDKTNRKYSINNVLTSFLTKGDKINIKTSEISFSNWKSNIKGKEEHDRPYQPSSDIFSSPDDYEDGRKYSREFTIISTDLFNSTPDSTVAYSYERDPEFKVQMIKTNESVGFVGVQNEQKYISYKNLKINIIQEKERSFTQTE